MELMLMCAKRRRFKFLFRKLLKYSLKKILSDKLKDFEFSPLSKEGIFPLLPRSCLISEWLCVVVSQLKNCFTYFTKLSRSLFEPLIFKCNLLLLRCFLRSIDLL